MDTLPNNDAIRAMLILIYGNAGKMILLNMLCTHGTISADPDCMDTKYRLLRAHVYSGLFWLGSWSRESTICTLTNWDEPMKNMTFISCFSIIFYGARRVSKVRVTFKKAKTQ